MIRQSSVTGLCLGLFLLTFGFLQPVWGQDVLAPRERKDGSEVRAAFTKAVRKAARSTVRIHDSDGAACAMGVVVDRGLVLTKASRLPKGELFCVTPEGGWLPVIRLGTAAKHDLALVSVEELPLPPVQFSPRDEPAVGRFVATVLPNEKLPAAVGVVSIPVMKAPNLWGGFGGRGGFLGVGSRPLTDEEAARIEEDRGVRVTAVTPDSGAGKAGMKKGDIIVRIDGYEVYDFESMARAISRRAPGETIRIEFYRGGKLRERVATLGKRPERRINPGLIGPTSARKAGFPKVFQHDTWLTPDVMGSPIVNLRGRCVGINVARVDRTATYAIPVSVIREVVDDLRHEPTGTSEER